MRNDLYWIWLTLKNKIQSRVMVNIVDYFGSVEEIYKCTDFSPFTGISAAGEKQLLDKSLDEAEKIVRRTEDIGGYIVTIDDDDYPFLLRNIACPPYVLYMKGKHMDWKRLLTITVVGTRNYSDYGRSATEYITGALAGAGVTIVSGMARGIDAIAGCAAIRRGAETVAVLGSGLDVVYPHEYKGFYNAISKNGVVMTEFPPGTRPLRENFPRRNRIMAGLSYGVIVMQAPEKSGALITAAHALENGRDVFAVPADIFSFGHSGTNMLIQNGAKLIISAEDVIAEYPYMHIQPLKSAQSDRAVKSGAEGPAGAGGDIVKKREPDEKLLEGLDENEACILKLLFGGSKHIDEISRELDMKASDTNVALTMLELQGLVKNSGSNIFSFKEI